ncbi:MAG: fatty-acyl-CoA synthase [Candidatus Magnetoglobus multicellularis str. Araruama]|uniref:Fatty-acyl-CoA synthase n=1 Tax=Candidatus Magnetoglobus multicellularis str. Araruama TaxID=890399 RepID=A0A1V1P535_9BACT|nr:MAG: fatty-acyl-CoA synthase [Candidatus Magnetoglobus multicellularis str. Araruama]
MPIKCITKTSSAYDYPLTIKQIFPTPMINFPNQQIQYRDKFSYTYAQFSVRVNKLANALKSLGIQEGDTVAVMDWDSHRYLECFFAIPMMGAILHTINIRLSPDQLIYTIEHAEDDILIINRDFVPLIESVKDRLTSVKKMVLITDFQEPPQSSIQWDDEYESMLSNADAHFEFCDFDENACATTFYTTGTTGLPKGVYFSHRQLVLHTLGLLTTMTYMDSQASFNSSDVYMPLTPMFHVHAWGFPYLATMIGVHQVYPGRYEPETILKLIKEQHVTISHCVPTILHMLLNTPSIRDMDLSNWQVIIGGSALPKSLCEEALNIGINVYAAYGMSETCPVLTCSNIKPHLKSDHPAMNTALRCKTGLPIPLVHLRIVDPDFNDVPADGKSTGEVVVRAPWLTQGYLNDPQKSEELWDGGWMHTGDIGHLDLEGYLQITDRLKDVIKTGGEWISSLELEDAILAYDGVSEAAVIGIPDEKWGERPFAMVVLSNRGRENTVTSDDIKVHLMSCVEKGMIPKYGVPDKIAIVDSIAKTSVGKINKRSLRQQFT